MSDFDFVNTFTALTGHAPMPWQESLYERFERGTDSIPTCCDIPTGLGKTSVIAVWMIALSRSVGNIPRRLVYVVNRRTVVDQTTDEVEKFQRNLASKGELNSMRDRLGTLTISTLRGQFADNQKWSSDPSRPAVICGTVDMIGSRLLFSGYRIGFKSKPLHAAFLGQDTLLVHDEAHLEPAFQTLVESIEEEQRRERTSDVIEIVWPAIRVMALSATNRGIKKDPYNVFGLTTIEREIPPEIPDPPTEPVHLVWKRLKAKKTSKLVSIEDESKALVDAIVQQALAYEHSGRAILVFTRTVEDVGKIAGKLPKDVTKQLTGTLRGLERDQLVRSPILQRFFPESNRDPDVETPDGTVYLVCTSAGEVGVNISADHLVCDLSTFDSMAQRFGRVNRFGERDDTEIHVVHPTSFEKKGKLSELDKRRQKTLDLLGQLDGDASPFALGQLDVETRIAAFTPEPTITPASDILFDAWSLTTIREKMPGRPPVEPYLHGVTEWEPPQTQVAWREEVDLVNEELAERFPPESLLEDYPLKPHELLKDRSDRVFKALVGIAKRHPNSRAWLLSNDGEIKSMSVAMLADVNRKTRINGQTVLLPPSVGGLTGGLLDGKAGYTDRIDYDVADTWKDEQQRQCRTRVWNNDEPPDGMALIRVVDIKADDEGFEPGDIEQNANAKRFWRWFVRPREAENLTRASTRPITLKHHTADVVTRMRQILLGLQLPEDLGEALILAADFHDLGKRRESWQRGIGNPNPTEWYAKPGKPEVGKRWRPRRFSSYRHEFGSLLDILDPAQEYRARFEQLSESMRDLVLHVIASHHGRARPLFPTDELFDPTPGAANRANEQTLETPLRFARLQRKYGRWGLAYIESLLRAADWAASAEPSKAREDNS